MSEIEAEIRRQMLAERAQNEAGPQIPPLALPPGIPTASQPSSPAANPSAPAAIPSTGNKATQRKGLAGALTAIGVALAKFWALILSVLLKLKVLLVGFKLLTFGKI